MSGRFGDWLRLSSPRGELVIVGKLGRAFGVDPSHLDPFSLQVVDIGWADGPGGQIASPSRRRPEPDKLVVYDTLRIDRDARAAGVGRAVIAEHLAYDLRHRSQIPVTGLLVKLGLSAAAADRYVAYLGDLSRPDSLTGNLGL